MKKTQQKKLSKKRLTTKHASWPSGRGLNPGLPESSLLEPALPDFIKLLALECWRIKKLLPEFMGNKKCLVLNSSVEKMLEALAGSGVEGEDPEGMEFRDGMTLDVALFEETASLMAGKRVISETLAPTVYIKDRLVQAAKVIVLVGT